MNKLETLVQEFIKTNDSTTLEAYMATDEYLSMNYVERNKYFITASKLKLYAECPYFAKLKWIDGVDAEEEDKDYFIVGQALDDKLTRPEYYEQKYEVVARRGVSEKTQLTNSMGETVNKMYNEFLKNEMFPKEIKKKNVIWLAFDKYPCKAELDHYEPGEIVDTKTTANILTFSPMNYLHQMTFYYGGILEKYNERCSAKLCVVDKYEWARSHQWIFSKETLAGHLGRINQLIIDWVNSCETGLFPMCDVDTREGMEIAFSSPYYTLIPECRTTKPTII